MSEDEDEVISAKKNIKKFIDQFKCMCCKTTLLTSRADEVFDDLLRVHEATQNLE